MVNSVGAIPFPNTESNVLFMQCPHCELVCDRHLMLFTDYLSKMSLFGITWDVALTFDLRSAGLTYAAVSPDYRASYWGDAETIM